MVSHSALNRSLLAFEEELGVDIFDRVATGVRLSSAGEHLMGLIDSHLNAFDDFQSLVSDMQGGPRGSLRLSLASELTTGLVPEAIAAFQDTAPRVTLEVVVADDASRLVAHEVDLAIVTAPATDSTAEVLVSHRTGLVARSARAEIRRASDLQAYRLILPPEGSGSRSVADHLLRKNRLSPVGTSGFAGLWPACVDEPAPQVQLLPQIALPVDADPGMISEPLAQVQIAILRRQGVTLTRSAQLFLTRVESMLDRAEAQSEETAP